MFSNPLNKIFILNFSENSDCTRFSKLLSPKRSKGLNTADISINKKAGILGEVIVQNALKAHKGCFSPFSYGEHGKPYFETFKDFHFNVSHSGNFVAAAFSESAVGLDIEVLRQSDLKIANRFFSEEEKEYAKDNETFFHIWTRKEAFIKQTGEGMSRPLPSFNCLDMTNIQTFNRDNLIISVCGKPKEKYKILFINEHQLSDC